MCSVGTIADVAERSAINHLHRNFLAGLQCLIAGIGLELAIVVVHYRGNVHSLIAVGLYVVRKFVVIQSPIGFERSVAHILECELRDIFSATILHHLPLHAHWTVLGC